MKDILFIGQGRTGTEPFLNALKPAIPNSNRIKLNRLTVPDYKKSYNPGKCNIIKLYLEIIWNKWFGEKGTLDKEIADFFLDNEKYHILFMFRSDYVKTFITRKLQDNLTNDSSNPYNHFSINLDEMEYVIAELKQEIIRTRELLDSKGLSYFFFDFDVLLSKKRFLLENEMEDFLGIDFIQSLFEAKDVYWEHYAVKYITNFKEVLSAKNKM